MKMKMLSAILTSLLLTAGLVSAAGAAEVLAWKTKHLDLAGDVLATTSFLADVAPGQTDTVCIVISPVNWGVTITGVEHRKTTARGSATLSNITISVEGTMLCVDVLAVGEKVKTVHLKAIVSTGEGIGVNLRY